MIIFKIIEYFLIVIGGGLIGYQFVLSLLSLGARDIKDFKTKQTRKFVIVIPAHNEEEVLARTLYSLFAVIYPRNLYEVVVVADNCTDRTADIALDLGTIVLERLNRTQQGKGYALRWAFDQILEWDEDFDAVIVLDSDSLISGNFLEVMNYYLENGNKVIQSSDLVLPQPGVQSSETTRIGFLLVNYVKPLGRRVLGLDIGLRGNGMCFAADVLRNYPWQAWSLTEDLEYGLHLKLEGIRITFAPEANIWAQMPAKAEHAESQRARWEMGRYPVIKKYAGKFLNRFFRKGSFRYFDTFIELITPPLVNLLFFAVLMVIFSLILWAFGALPPLFIWIWLGFVGLGGLYLFTGMIAAGADKKMYKAVLYIPWYVFWKLKVYATKFINGIDKQWIRTTRNSGNK
jgi:cellulose synthase/poly-beta-1,6-N-acetylglucosamine synthase-like glycosyltransferase